MVDKEGHLIHIDFGFVFGLAPGKALSMEKAPWKLNKELASVMGGRKSPMYADYRQRCIDAFTVARRHAKEVTLLMNIMIFHSNYPAFRQVQPSLDFIGRR
jgi:phosphatidylinositol kinase/protein kinase (PI-3  family)